MTGAPTGVLHGENLGGRSALPLLGCDGVRGRTLFLLSAREAVVARSPLADGQFRRIALDAVSKLPFLDRVFDCVVLDSEGVPNGALVRRISHLSVSREIRRVLRENGACLLMTRLSRIPRSKSALSRYRLRLGAKAWRDAMMAAAFSATDAGYLAADGERITEVFRPSDGNDRDRSTPRAADYMVTSFRREASSGVPVVEKLFQQIAGALGERAEARVERFLVRKIGKTTILVSIGGRRLLVKVPLSPIARARAERNFRALQQLHQSEVIPPEMRALIPKPVLHQRCDEYPFYVEEVIDGRELDAASLSASWEPGALQFITRLHVQTRQPRVVDEACFQARFAGPVRAIQHAASLKGAADSCLFDGIVAAMRDVIGTRLPFVWAHGDFALGNCLYDRVGRLSAVVDWELFSCEGLPLLDLLHCMPVVNESNSHSRWQRFDAVGGLLERDTALQHVPEFARYIATVGVPTRAVPALLIMYWIDHVANRIESRGSDGHWMQKRLFQPLSLLSSLTEAAVGRSQ